MRRFALRAALALTALPLAYLLAALIGGLVPVNRDFAPARDGIAIYLRTNGVHAELVLPARAPHDFAREFPVAQVIDPARARAPGPLDWIAFGWGDRGFYLHTPTWRELRPRTAAVAVLGLGTAAMHVEYLARPLDYRALRVVVNEDQYRALIAAVRAGFRRDPTGAPLRIDHPGYFGTDAFYEGTGRYTLWLTSNEWVRRALAEAGVRTALWAPFDVAVFWQLRD